MEKIEAAYRAATEDMTEPYLAVLRRLEPGARLHQAFGLWRMARAALVRQELERGRAPDEAFRAGVERMLQMGHDTTA